MKFSTAVDLHSVDEYAEMSLFRTIDGDGGFAIDKKGNLTSLFNVGTPGIGRKLVKLAFENRATQLSCYDLKLSGRNTSLADYYRRLGLSAVAQCTFDKLHRPKDWKESNGTPDCIFFVVDKDNVLENRHEHFVNIKGTIPYYDTYEECEQRQQAKRSELGIAPIVHDDVPENQENVGTTKTPTGTKPLGPLHAVLKPLHFVDNLAKSAVDPYAGYTKGIEMEKERTAERASATRKANLPPGVPIKRTGR